MLLLNWIELNLRSSSHLTWHVHTGPTPPRQSVGCSGRRGYTLIESICGGFGCGASSRIPDPNPSPSRTRTLCGDQCLDAVDCEGSRSIRSARVLFLGKTLGLFDWPRDAVAWKDSRLIAPLTKYPSANQSA